MKLFSLFCSNFDIDFTIQLVICLTVVSLMFPAVTDKKRRVLTIASLSALCSIFNTLLRMIKDIVSTDFFSFYRQVRFYGYILLLFLGVYYFSVLNLKGSKRQFAATALYIINACDLSITIIRQPLNFSPLGSIAMYALLLLILMVYRHVTYPIDAEISNFYFAFLIAAPLFILALQRINFHSQPSAQRNISTSLFLLMLDFSIYFLFCRLSKEVTENFNLTMENSRMNQQIHEMNNTENLLKTIRKQRHELKNNYFILDSYLQQRKYDEMADYLHKTMIPRLQDTMTVSTGNRFIDMLLTQKASEAKMKKIPIMLDVMLPEKLRIDEKKLGGIMLNLLDNAIEASANLDNPGISLTMHQKKGYITIQVSNSIQSSVLSVNPMLKTSKQNPALHGFGLQIVRRSVEQYDGAIDIRQEAGRFIVSVLLPAQQD